MAGPAVNVLNPTTGEHGSVAEDKFSRARAAGARQQTDDETTALVDQQKHDNLAEAHWAATVGTVRGIGEALGQPTDSYATSIADTFGKREATQKYLNDLRTYHPIASGGGEVLGQVGASIGLAELTGGGGAAAETAAGRIAARTAGGALRGGMENLVVSSTHDVNETALGNAGLAGEKLLAEMPKHFMLGAGIGGVLAGGGAALGEVGAVLKRPAAEMLDHQASAAVGRELGGDAARGAEIRGRMGSVPQSRGQIADFLSHEQAGFREASTREAVAARKGLELDQSLASWRQSEKGATALAASEKEAAAAVKAVETRHAAARDALKVEHAEAVSAFGQLSEERAAAKARLKNLAGELDKVKGAELPNAQNILREASAQFNPADPSLTPPSPRALELFSQWADGFAGKYSEPGKLTFSELQNVIKGLDTMEVRQRVVSGWGNDPEVKRAFDSLRKSAKAEFDRASASTAAGVSEAKALDSARLRASIPDLDKAVFAAEENLDRLGGVMKDFESGAAQELKQAERDGFRMMRDQQRTAAGEDRTLRGEQRAEIRSLPKPSRATPVDDLLRRARAPQEPGGVGAMGLLGAGAMLMHGNVAGAAMSAVSGIAAQTAKAKGNLLAARTLSALADSIAKADGTIARLAGRAVGRYARATAEVAADDKSPQKPRLTFEKVSQRVREAESNPMIIEQRVRTQAGPWAQVAPGIYSSMMSAAMRSQSFLSSKLPPSRSDPYSLTPHLDEGDLSDTEKYDFVQYAKAVDDPVSVLRAVADGSVTPQQVEALEAVYPSLYNQMKVEVQRRVADLSQPLDYERAVNVGTLLQIDTAEVMTGEFQSMQADMYTARAESEKLPGGSKPRGVNSRLSRSMESAGQALQGED